MPTYEFKCPKCGARDEIAETMADIGQVVVLCIEESCWVGIDGNGTEMKRVFNPVASVFKGSGFYRTDSRPAPKPEKSEAKAAVKKKAANGE